MFAVERLRFPAVLCCLCLVLLLSGCAATSFDVSGTSPVSAALCPAGEEPRSAVVLWRPQWRSDQKDVSEREAASERGINRYFNGSPCFTPVTVRRLPVWLPAGDQVTAQQWRELLRAARSFTPSPDRIVVITVRELGPVLRLFTLPALVEGGTEVVLDIRVLHAVSGEIQADFRAHWRHGGPWVIKGVGSLEQDMASALTAALAPGRQTGTSGTPAR